VLLTCGTGAWVATGRWTRRQTRWQLHDD